MDPKVYIEANTELRHRFVSLMDSLSGIGALSRLNTDVNPEQVLINNVMRVLLESQDLERCSLFLVDGNRLRCTSGHDWNDNLKKGNTHQSTEPAREFLIGEGIIGIAAETHEVEYCSDCAADPRFADHPDPDNLPGCIICIPVMSGDNLIGVLNASHPDADFFHQWHQHMLSIFGTMLGQIISYNRLLLEMECAVERRTKQLENSLTEARSLKIRYEQLSFIDDLTQLYNRRFFFPESEAALSRCMRNNNQFSILLLDIDLFKNINDDYGHAVGDRVLVDIANLLREEIRTGDILARFGGEEFVLALPDTDEDGAKLLATRISDSLCRTKWKEDENIFTVTASIGISTLNEHETPLEDALKRILQEADQSLYYCKQNGRNRQCSFAEMKSA